MPADEARRDATRLARRLLGWDEAAWLTRRLEAAPADFPARFAGLVGRRVRREPLAYILGEREFYGRAFQVTPDVLIPRPETELVVDQALEILRVPRRTQHPAPSTQHSVIVDVGTGSGCLAITIALECPDARVIAVDVSAAALDVARENARRHGVVNRIEFRQGDLLQPVTEPADLIVSNPPYVPERDRASLAPDVVDYEPAGALFAGVDGLDVIRTLIPAAARALAPGGALVMEFGWEQSDAVARLIQQTPGLTLRHVRPDLQGIPRVAVAERTD